MRDRDLFLYSLRFQKATGTAASEMNTLCLNERSHITNVVSGFLWSFVRGPVHFKQGVSQNPTFRGGLLWTHAVHFKFAIQVSFFQYIFVEIQCLIEIQMMGNFICDHFWSERWQWDGWDFYVWFHNIRFVLLYSHCCNHTRNIYQLCVSAQFNLVNEVKKMFIAADEMRWSSVRKSLALTLYMEISQSKCEQQEDPPPPRVQTGGGWWLLWDRWADKTMKLVNLRILGCDGEAEGVHKKTAAWMNWRQETVVF